MTPADVLVIVPALLTLKFRLKDWWARKKGKTAGGKVALADLVVFTRQLATMLDAGLAMVQSLQALAEQTTNKVMRDTIKDVCTRVEGGDSFSEALSKHPKTFNKLYVCMVAAGEKGGLLAEILARLATYLENTYYPADVTWNGIRVRNAGVRSRGRGSRSGT